MLRLGFLGAGAVADLLAVSASEVDGVSLVGVYDVRGEVAEAKGRSWGVPAYSSPEGVLDDPGVDAVCVLSHVDSHLDLATRALMAGKHVFVEKPVSDDPEGIEELDRLARSRELVCMPDHNYAHIPEFRRLRRLVEAGDLGTIRSFHVNYVIPHAEELASRYGGVLAEVMVHHAYMSLIVLGPPDRISAGTANPAWERHSAEDQAWMVWEYDSGASAHLFATFATDDLSSSPWTSYVKVLGTNGTATVDWRNSMFNRQRGTHAHAWAQYEESFAEALTAFRDAVLHGAEVPSTLGHAASSARIIAEGYRSARDGTSIPRRRPDATLRW
jgi:predicted dehydrogenase